VADVPVDLDELVDLKILPAWVSEPPAGERFAQHEGDNEPERGRRDRRDNNRKPRTSNVQRPTSESGSPRIHRDRRPGERFRDRKRTHGRDRHQQGRPGFVKGRAGPDALHDKHRQPDRPLPNIAVKFLPRAAALENVVEQIKSGTVAYSLFALARLFLEKAPRHDVTLTALPEVSLFQLGENGAISVDRRFLERNAFRFAQSDFYKVDITETEPIKGNFTNVARCRLSGMLLGPTNHHDYQRRLRNLYEQRFSRRMSFGDYQRQIQIKTDPAEIEKWKDDARKVTTFTTLRDEPPETFSSMSEAERHFEKNCLPGLVRSISEVTIDGPASRRMHDRVLNRLIENEWNLETKSPSPMMQELATRFRESGLHVFRHRRGMLFVSPIYPRPFSKQQTAVSSQVRTLVEAIAAQPRIGRKELADKLIVDLSGDEAERAKLALASDLLWLISAGHVIEFNDGSLDLPRAKTPKPKQESSVEAGVPPADESAQAPKETAEAAAVSATEREARVEVGAPQAEESETVMAGVSPAVESRQENEGVVAAAVSAAEPKQASVADASTTEETEIGGS
jgi:hypothetical protein